MEKIKLVLGVAGLAALLSAAEFVRKPIEFTDTLVGYSVNKTDADYGLQFGSNYVTSASLKDSNKTEITTGSKYHVVGYESFWGKTAKTVEAVN